jgi:hypothetical protein
LAFTVGSANTRAPFLLQPPQVSAANVVDSSGNPHPGYTQLPGTPTWHQAPDSSGLTVWLPPDADSLQGNWQMRPCNGLDVYVEQPKDVQQAVG